MDLDYDLSCAFHTPELLERKIRMLAAHDFETLHIVAPPPGNPEYSHAVREWHGEDSRNFLRRSREALGGNPLRLAVEYAKLAGLEVIIEFKPYEGGGVFTVPHGEIPHGGQNFMETLGGRAVGLDPFILENPSFLLERRPCDDLRSEAVERVELVYMLDKIDGDEGVKQLSFDDDVISRSPLGELRIHVSFDNGTYQLYEAPFRIREYIDTRMVEDSNGVPVFPKLVRCRIVEISGLEIDAPYFSVSFTGEPTAFRMIPFSMCSAFNARHKLPVTVSPTIRPDSSGRLAPFAKTGFEFEEIAPYTVDSGWRACMTLGFARGRMKRLRGALCEAYPRVREYWLDQIREFISMGIAGVDIRLQNHCSGVTDFVNYGFNPPVVEAYRNVFSENILAGPCDPIKLMRVRGDFFEMFLREAGEVLHRNNCRLSVQLHAFMERPSLSTSLHELGFWANAKILPDWRKLVDLADDVVIKNYNFGEYFPGVANEIKNYAAEREKPLWIHCYLQQGHDWNASFLQAVDADPRVTGLLLYEVVWNNRENDGIIQIDGNNVTWVWKNTST